MTEKTSYEDLLKKAFDSEIFRREGHQIVDTLADFLAESTSGRRRRVLDYEDPAAKLRRWEGRFDTSPSGSASAILREVLDQSINLFHPRYVGHQCTTVLPLAALSGFVGQFLNNSTAIYEMAPVSVAMERTLIRWMTGLADWGSGADGVLTSGGSIGNLTALLAARQATAAENVWTRGVGSESPAAVLVSEQSHYSVKRAVAIAGWGEDAAVPVAVDDRFHMSPAGLERAYSDALRSGARPMALVANACSTATGSYDDIDAAASFAGSRGLWFHVDAAHGAAALLSPKYRRLLRGLERADSFIWDAHKNMLMPSLITAVLFRDGGRSHEAFSAKASYLFEKSPDEEWYNIAHRTMECTKTMIALRIFVSLAAYGTDFFANVVTSVYDLAREFAALIRESGDFETAVDPESNIVCFRYLKKGEGDLDGLQRRIRRRLLEEGRFYVVQTELNGRIWLRCTLINPQTQIGDLEDLLREIRAMAG